MITDTEGIKHFVEDVLDSKDQDYHKALEAIGKACNEDPPDPVPLEEYAEEHLHGGQS